MLTTSTLKTSLRNTFKCLINKMKVYIHGPRESWIVDRYKQEFCKDNLDIVTEDPRSADIIWLLADWTWNQFPLEFLASKKVLTTVFHICPENSGDQFKALASVTDHFHAASIWTKEEILKLGVNKPITTSLMWCDEDYWKSEDKGTARKKLNLPQGKFLVGSFQRDTQGNDLVSPKLIKGPDIFCDYVEFLKKKNDDVEVLLGGWRRQYVQSRLERAGIKYHYFEMAPLDFLKDMYNSLDLYVVGSRIEGGPNALFECGMTKTPIISTRVGVSPELLHQDSLAREYSGESLLQCKPNVDFHWGKMQECKKKLAFSRFRSVLKSLLQ